MNNINADEIAEVKPSYEFNFDSMPILNNLTSLRQDGNYLVGITEGGTRFSQRIPSDKMLSKNEKGEWSIVPMRNS